MKTALGILALISLLSGCAYPGFKCDDPDVRPAWCDDTGSAHIKGGATQSK